MKNTFPGYYQPTQKEFADLWKECLFIPDANVLLNLYRYNEETSNSLIDIFSKLATFGRLRITHQAAWEYHKRRLDVISDINDDYDKIQKSLTSIQNTLDSIRNPFILVAHLKKLFEPLINQVEEELEKMKTQQPNFYTNDPIRQTITSLFQGMVSKPYIPEQLEDIFKLGKVRYEAKIPPGYLDAEKGGNYQYGDLVLWFQIIDIALETKKPVIFITDDKKEDWWLKHKGKTIGPRPELVKEMADKANVPFYMYQTHQFMLYAKKFSDNEIKEEVIEEVKRIHPDKTTLEISYLSERVKELAETLDFNKGKVLQKEINRIEEALNQKYDELAKLEIHHMALTTKLQEVSGTKDKNKLYYYGKWFPHQGKDTSGKE
ncbi:MAG: PIN-like domain-containing protein [Bacillota bacterium]